MHSGAGSVSPSVPPVPALHMGEGLEEHTEGLLLDGALQAVPGGWGCAGQDAEAKGESIRVAFTSHQLMEGWKPGQV